MSDVRWQRANDLFTRALERDAGERLTFRLVKRTDVGSFVRPVFYARTLHGCAGRFRATPFRPLDGRRKLQPGATDGTDMKLH
jgi:hypothetical protein